VLYNRRVFRRGRKIAKIEY